jgi:hypothetical protein
MSKFTRYGPEPQGTGITGKTGMSILQVLVGIAVYYTIPEAKEEAVGAILIALLGLGIGSGHKVYKGSFK